MYRFEAACPFYAKLELLLNADIWACCRDLQCPFSMFAVQWQNRSLVPPYVACPRKSSHLVYEYAIDKIKQAISNQSDEQADVGIVGIHYPLKTTGPYRR